ncbi:hypothetical protein FHX37_4363 [Haloactinospora alba]|uniref:Uncharacterized protein n=1 Tax=Haloactinospora alba TaxID=405555 RepID=A0A543N727_9ACTN|nr:hypothetical protein FHX37_4363 [Haloactinospora alba]
MDACAALAAPFVTDGAHRTGRAASGFSGTHDRPYWIMYAYYLIVRREE